MKKIGLFLVCISIMVLTGCGTKKVKETKYEKTMKGYAKEYYEDNMKNVVGQNVNKVSIKALKKFNETYGEKYDLSLLSTCKEDSYIDITVNGKTREIKKYGMHLECK